MTVRLMQLKNGDWINPRIVDLIQAADEMTHVDGLAELDDTPPRVIISMGFNHSVVIEYPTFGAACEARDALAAVVNENAD